MAKMIDAIALTETLEALSERTPSQRDTLRIIATGLRSDELFAPTIDPESLRPHGRWIGIEYDGYADGCPVYDLWECSNCGQEESGEDVPEQNPYCRGCGAKMDLEEEK